MAIEQDKLGLEVYKILAAREYGYNMTMYDTESNPTTTPLKAKWIYVKPVNFMLQLPDPAAKERPEIYFWKQQGEHDEIVEQLIQRVRKACNQFGVGLTVNDFAEENVPKQFQKIVSRHNEERQMDESVQLDESMTGNSKRSYYVLENARLVVIHGKRINEEVRGARTRNIKEIYVESKGERFKYPTKYLQGAKAMAQHINQGGGWSDAVGSAIQESGKEIMSMTKLIKECKLNGCWPIYEKARRFVNEVKSTMKRMQGPRGYTRLSESIRSTPRIGKQVIESRCKSISALTGLNESEDLLEAYKYFARHDLHEDKLNESVYKRVIESCMQDLDPRMARSASRAVTRGDVAFTTPMRQVPAAKDQEQRVLLYSSALAECIDNELVAVALSEMCERGTVTQEDARFVAGVLKSAKLNEFKTQRSTSEPQELLDWVNKITSNLL